MKKILVAIGFLAIGFALIMSTHAQAACSATTWDLTAGQTIKVGTVSVRNDAANLYITYTLTYPKATLGTLHMWVGTDLALLPTTKTGNPIPGQFPFKVDATGLTTSTLAIPLSTLGIEDETKVCGENLYIATHAEVSMGSQETAWGGNIVGDTGNRWWFYGSYAICCDQPALVTLKSFTAKFYLGKIFLQWKTASEFDNYGFNLVRSEEKDGDYEVINSHIIPAKGTPVRGGIYLFADKGVKRGKTYYYKLEDIDLDGTSTFHGPVQVTIK